MKSFIYSGVVASALLGLSPAKLTAQVLDNPVAVPVTVHVEFNSPTTETLTVKWFGETSSPYDDIVKTGTGSGTSYLTEPLTMMLRPGVTYSVEVSGNANIVSYRIELTQPVGYEVLLSNVSGSDLIARNIYPADNTLNDPDTFQFLVRPTGFSGAVRKVGEATSWSTDRLIWEVGMGQLKNGNAAGAISIQADDFSEITYTPSDLNYSSPSTEVSVVLDSSTGALRQVNAPQALADIVDGTPNDDKYEIRFYSWKDVTGWNGTIYTVMGTPFVTYEISKPANEEISIKKTFATGTDYYTTHLRYLSAQMTWEMYDWTLNLDAVGNSMRKVITVVTSTGETIGSTKTTVIEEYGRKLENND